MKHLEIENGKLKRGCAIEKYSIDTKVKLCNFIVLPANLAQKSTHK